MLRTTGRNASRKPSMPSTRAWGSGAVLFGVQGDGRFNMTQEHKSPHYATLWKDLPKVSVNKKPDYNQPKIIHTNIFWLKINLFLAK
ncbi:MAG: DUF4113 domain-containing protein [Bacteroidales bacterium]|nr:DUF4113 domain-containing protein [Bacteroidales bacterium]